MPSPRALGWRGCVALDELIAPVETLEAVADAIRAAPREAAAIRIDLGAFQHLGLTPDTAATLLKALGFARTKRAQDSGASLWRARKPPHPVPGLEARAAKPASVDGPFAALAALNPPERRARRSRRPRRVSSRASTNTTGAGGGAA